MQTITALVFENYETLDLFGPVEMLGHLPEQEDSETDDFSL